MGAALSHKRVNRFPDGMRLGCSRHQCNGNMYRCFTYKGKSPSIEQILEVAIVRTAALQQVLHYYIMHQQLHISYARDRCSGPAAATRNSPCVPPYGTYSGARFEQEVDLRRDTIFIIIDNRWLARVDMTWVVVISDRDCSTLNTVRERG